MATVVRFRQTGADVLGTGAYSVYLAPQCRHFPCQTGLSGLPHRPH